MASLIEVYLKRGHVPLHGRDWPYVFSDKKGRHMAAAPVMSEYWRQLLLRMGSPTFFPPHRQVMLP